ncbi:MAG: DNA translocase FtsK, partial [Chloroflexi bacterium]|nr:DNA translocase FtsK [Chloroflexota bacterium]
MAGKLARLLIFNRWGRLALLTTTLALLLFLTQDTLLEEVYPPVRDRVLRTVGFGFFPLALWLSTAVAAMRLEPRWLARRWRWWLSAALLATGIQTALGGVHGPEGIISDKTLGGIAGQYLWGNSPLQGVPVTAVALLLAAAVLHPTMTYRTGVAITRALAQLLLLLGYWLIRGTRSTARWAATLLATKRTRTVDEQPAAPDHVAEPTPAYSGSEDESLPSNDLATEDEDDLPAEEPVEENEEPEPAVTRRNELATTYASGGWRLPAIDLLEQGLSVSITEEETQEVAGRIEESLSNHGVQVTVDQVKPGPTVTLYGLTPGWVRRHKDVRQRDEEGAFLRDDSGRPVITRQEEQTRVKVDSILAREKDLALSLAAPSLRIQAPVPGESIVGIEVPNREPILVTIRSVLETPGFQDIVKGGGLALALGQGSGGDPIAADLRQLPHLLIAGATGSGKSVCINALIISLVTHVSPENLRLLLIDPKRVELTPFNGLPHLATPVVVDSEPAVKALK